MTKKHNFWPIFHKRCAKVQTLVASLKRFKSLCARTSATHTLEFRNRLEVRKMDFHNLLILSDPDFRNPALDFDFGDHLRLMRQNKDKVEKMFKIYNIYETNTYSTSGVYLKISRINHSCRANAVFSKGEVRTVHKIKAGQEINLNYSMVRLFLVN